MRLMLIEDELLVAQRLERFCRDVLGASLERLQTASSFDQASAWLAENTVDVVLLDLNLQGQDGMELLRRSVASSFHTIVVSANTDRALEAFEHGVIDFVPKPFTRERLMQALARLRNPAARATFAARHLAVKKAGRIELVAMAELLYVQGAGNYSELVLDGGRRELHDKTLEKLEAILPADFERIHKSFLVRMSAVKALHASEGSHYEVELKNGTCLPIGRSRYKEIKEKLQ
jgi:two-component system, LytTR family, response regulator LytT